MASYCSFPTETSGGGKYTSRIPNQPELGMSERIGLHEDGPSGQLSATKRWATNDAPLKYKV